MSLVTKAADFFFTVTCACEASTRYKHLLCISSLALVLSGQVLMSNAKDAIYGSHSMGKLNAALSLTSIAYHATHSPVIRSVDVLLLWLVASCGLLMAVATMAAYGPTIGHILGISMDASLLLIFQSPATKVKRDANVDMIALPWHVMVHLISGCGLYLLAVGNATAFNGAWTVPGLGKLDLEGWSHAACAIIPLLLAMAGFRIFARRARGHSQEQNHKHGVACRPRDA